MYSEKLLCSFGDTAVLNLFRVLLCLVILIECLIPLLLSAGFIYAGLVLDWLFQISVLVPGWDYAAVILSTACGQNKWENQNSNQNEK